MKTSEDLAASEGINVERYDLLYLFSIAVIVALGVKLAGGLLTAALVAVPPSAARNLARNLRQYAVGSVVVGAAATLVGILLARLTELPAGPLIVLVSTALFLCTLPFLR